MVLNILGAKRHNSWKIRQMKVYGWIEFMDKFINMNESSLNKKNGKKCMKTENKL